jgi:hypothetical protein
MSLLTNEQIAELIGIASNQSTSRDLHDELHEWNEKQTTQQIEIDWNNAPKYVVGAALNLAWLTENGSWALGYQIEKYDKPAPVITPHPRAEIMAQYAKVAARRVDPWVEFEYRFLGDEWSKCKDFIRFYDAYEYRHMGDDK